MSVSPAQIRAGRGLADISQKDLAARCSVSLRTIVSFERGATTPIPSTLAAIRAALEAAGVEFIPENGGGAGVRLRTP